MAKKAELALILSLVDDVSKTARSVKGELVEVGKTSKGAQKTIQGLSKFGFGALGVAAGAAGVAIGAVSGFLASTIGPASDLSETTNKAAVVFGEEANAVLAFSKTAARSLGMTENAALSAAGTYGNLFRAMGMGEKQSAGMSTSLVGLAADLASFNNMDPTDVLDALRSGLSGETEPLKRLGVNINQALLQEKALEMGLWDGEGALDAATKAQATYALIMEQTSLAQGDFARTSGGLANQQRILKATFSDLKADLGTALLPALEKLMGAIGKITQSQGFQDFLARVTEGLGRFAEKVGRIIDQLAGGNIGGALAVAFGAPVAKKILDISGAIGGLIDKVKVFVSEHSEELKAALIAIAAVLAAAMIATTIAGIAGAIASLANPITAVIVAVGLLAAAWEGDWGGIRTWMTDFWDNTIQPIFEDIGEWLEEKIPAAIETVSGFWKKTLQPAIEGMWRWLTKAADAVENGLGKALGWLKDTILTPVTDALQKVSDKFSDLTGWIKGFGDKIGKIELPKWLKPGSPTPFEIGLRGISSAMADLARQGLPAMEATLTARPGMIAPVAPISGNNTVINLTVEVSGSNAATVREDARRGANIGVLQALRAAGVNA